MHMININSQVFPVADDTLLFPMQFIATNEMVYIVLFSNPVKL